MTHTEATYNILVCQLLLDDSEKAQQTMEQLSKLLPKEKSLEL